VNTTTASKLIVFPAQATTIQMVDMLTIATAALTLSPVLETTIFLKLQQVTGHQTPQQ
jgi:hypothetical protein